MTLRAVLLDLDDTLVDTRGAFRVAVHAVVEQWLPHLSADEREDAVLHWARDPGGSFRAFTRGELGFAEQRRRRAQDLHARFAGPALDDDAYGHWDALYESAFRAAWRPAPGAAALLGRLAAAGLATGALTNLHRADQEAKLVAVGLDLPVLVAVDDLGVGKPDPRVFALACERAGVAPGEAAYVGDELDVDARAAAAAGLVGVWLDVHGTGADADGVLVARTLADVPGLLAVP